MTLREQYYNLENKVYEKYNELIKVGDYNFLPTIIKEYYDSNSDEILSLLDEQGINEVIEQYSVKECLEQIFYNDRNGDERMGYLLGVEKDAGIYIFDNENWREDFIPFHSLNGVMQQIIVIETIEND